MISIKLFIIIEKTATPRSKTIDPINFSSELFGLKSPYPIVESVVMAQYQSLIIISVLGISL
jgi:hypothetical protein